MMENDESWRKLLLSKSNNSWAASSNYIEKEYEDKEDRNLHAALNIKQERQENDETTGESQQNETRQEDSSKFSRQGDLIKGRGRRKINRADNNSVTDPLDDSSKKVRKKRGTLKRYESRERREIRLAKMSEYAAKRLATESIEERAVRLARMSAYTATKLAHESIEERAKRLARMSAYTARKLANETPEKRRERLDRMSLYAAKKQAGKK